jgi:hypothetical protein
MLDIERGTEKTVEEKKIIVRDIFDRDKNTSERDELIGRLKLIDTLKEYLNLPPKPQPINYIWNKIVETGRLLEQNLKEENTARRKQFFKILRLCVRENIDLKINLAQNLDSVSEKTTQAMRELKEYVDENHRAFSGFIEEYANEDIISRAFIFGYKKEGKLIKPGLLQNFTILKLKYEHILKHKDIPDELRENIQDNIFRLSLILDVVEQMEKVEEKDAKTSNDKN